MAEEKFQSIYGDAESEFEAEDVSDETLNISKEEIEEQLEEPATEETTPAEEPVPEEPAPAETPVPGPEQEPAAASDEESIPDIVFEEDVHDTHEDHENHDRYEDSDRDPDHVYEDVEEEPRRGKKGLIIAGVVIGALAVAYVGASFYFQNRFPFNTTVDGKDVSLQTAEQVAASMQSDALQYTLTITGRNGVTDTITADEIGMTYEPQNELTGLIGRSSMFAWPLSLVSHTEYTTTTETEFNEEQLESIVPTLAFYDTENVIQPTDASYGLVDGEYQIIPEDDGALLDDSKTISEIALAIANGETSLDLDAAGCYQSATVTTSDSALTADVTTLNQFSSMEIHIPIGAGDGENIDAATIASWIVAEEDQQAGMEAGGDNTDNAAAAAADAMAAEEGTSGLPSGFTFDTNKISEYVANLAEKYNTYGKSHSFKTHSGSTYTTSIGNYGWWLNQESTKAAILTALNSGVGGEVEPVYNQKANQWPTDANGGDDIGDTYAEVDLDNQHMYMVKNGQVVLESDFVSGKATAERMTPDGIYRLTFKQLDATLKGEDYETPVKYWMPFNRGIGFHDANWRSYFGGKIYLSNGSHGCINLPPAKAAALYEYVYAGMPVVVYGGMTPSQASAYLKEHGSTSGTGTSTASGDSTAAAQAASSADTSTDASQSAGEAASTDTSAQDAANAAAAAQQVNEAANQIAQQIYQQQIAAGASEAEALAAAQAAANAAVQAAGQ